MTQQTQSKTKNVPAWRDIPFGRGTLKQIYEEIPAGSRIDTQIVLDELRRLANARRTWCRTAEESVSLLGLAVRDPNSPSGCGMENCTLHVTYFGYRTHGGYRRFPYLPDEGMPESVSARRLAALVHKLYNQYILPGSPEDVTLVPDEVWDEEIVWDGWFRRSQMLAWIKANLS